MPHKLMKMAAILMAFLCVLICTAGFILCMVWSVFSDNSLHPWQYLAAGLALVGAVLSAELLIYIKSDRKNGD